MPHLVLPLSGCLSRHTPTRATRGEARGHRSALAQNSLLMYPPSCSFLWTCRRSGVSSPYGGLAPMCFRCRGCTLPGFARWRYFVDMWVAEGHTARWPWLCVCCLCIASRCGCRPVSGMSTPSRCRGPDAQQMSMVSRPSWVQWSCEVVCVATAVVGPTMVTPEDRGGLGG